MTVYIQQKKPANPFTALLTKTVAILLLLLALCTLAHAEGDTIIVGGNQDYPPYEMFDKNGKPTGFTVDLIKAIAEVMGLNIEIRLGEWSKMREDLANGRIDMTLGMSQSADRHRVFDFPTAHTIVQHAIFASRGSESVSSLEDLRGKKVALHKGGAMHEHLSTLGFGRDLVLTKTPADALRLLASGECDYAIAALLPGMYIIRENKLTNLEPVVKNVSTFVYSFAVREGNSELVASLNEGLAILKKTGQYGEIYDKWLGVLEPRNRIIDGVMHYGGVIVIPLLLLLAGSIAWSRTLQKRVVARTEELSREAAERIRMLDELRVNQDRLVQADKMASLGILVSGVAHEINNPNGLILLNMPIIKDVYRDAEEILDDRFRNDGDFTLGGLPYSRMKMEVPQLLEEMQDGARRIKSIVEDLKDFARREDAADKEQFDLNGVVKAAIRLVDSSIRKSTHNFSVSYAGGLPMLSGNPRRIEQVVVNLLLNACQALAGPEGSIAVITRHDRHEDRIELTVRDEGRGISSDHMAHLTDPFFTTKRDSGGTGLGLSVSAGIVKEHGGLLTFDSGTDKGTTVTMILPCNQEQE